MRTVADAIMEGQIFSPMARTYGYALVGALIATFTVTPCLASLLLPEHVSEIETVVVRSLRSIYTPVLRWSLAHRAITVVVGLVFVAGTGLIGSRLGGEFLPALEEGNLWIRAAMPPTISLEAGATFAASAETTLPVVKMTSTRRVTKSAASAGRRS
jgi:heavy metal efflux system protein